MADRIKTGMTRLAARLKSYASQTVVYSRLIDTVSLSVTFGEPDYLEIDDTGNVVDKTKKDFLFTAADLILDGNLTTPDRGDRITHGTDIYEILPNDGTQSWKYSDAHKTIIRVHTKLVSN